MVSLTRMRTAAFKALILTNFMFWRYIEERSIAYKREDSTTSAKSEIFRLAAADFVLAVLAHGILDTEGDWN